MRVIGNRVLAVALALVLSVAVRADNAHPGSNVPEFGVAELAVDGQRVVEELMKLSSFSDDSFPAVTRIVFTPTDIGARDYVKSLCTEAGLVIREDGMGNIFARWVGSRPELGAIGTGSHMDAIPLAGMYDGTVGIVGGLEAIRYLQRSGFKPERSIELLIFTSEEPTRFKYGAIGSRVLSGAMAVERLLQVNDSDGILFEEARKVAGFEGDLNKVPLSKDYYYAFVELHIEQGPILEEENIDIGVVTSIAAPATLRVFFEGKGGHAGALLMKDRHDAFLAAAELALGLERAVLRTEANDLVGTTGFVRVLPNAVNSVPRRVDLEMDIRDVERIRRDVIIKSVIDLSDEIANRRGVYTDFTIINADDPSTSDPEVLEAINAAVEKVKISKMELVSRAYHDTLFMSQITRTGMIFIPCKGGYSHRPDEFSSEEQIRKGVQVLALTLAKLASSS
mmetsp:Transcript_38789/g.62815  ORF Transcript_38789/g.62815 Transcript_38789/m.62815 type:complete len:452 (-) Transcript_38789:27-1382(-)|eukprot:CAMPEP_0184656746 /NCGR_PEP_ID=MMETSP0308-20130426/16722_1 /TAXON_ID=38269 /ORGANISM="Gloeochaete witrockiana, Strain SAG 46.84" /LENGTH=451 /DNA_ID=CAMNT_0027094007 /DNA_START=29 /DNA_END=1384 /DNA_ORIENTATION=-